MKKLTRYLIEEDSSQCLKILSQYIVKKTKIDWQRFEMFCLREIIIIIIIIIIIVIIIIMTLFL